MQEYQICLGKETVGRAYVHQEGLYHCFQCRCDLKTDIICRVHVCCGDREENLGILVPEGGHYTLRKNIPIKRLGQGEFRFQLIPKVRQTRGKFAPVYPEEPFRYIRSLQNAYLTYQKGLIGVIIPEG